MATNNLFLEAQIRRGQLQAKGGKWKDAEATFAKVVEASQTPNARAIYLLGNAQFQQKNFSSAMHATERAVQLDPENAVWKVRLGALYERAKRYDAAALSYESAVKAQPKNVEWLLRLAKAQSSSSQKKAATETLRSALALDPNNLLTLNAYISQMNSTAPVWQRIEALQHGLTVESQNTAWLQQLGNCFMELDQYHDATKAFERAVELGSTDVQLAFNLGLAAANDGQESASLTAMNRACLLDSKYRSKEFGPGAYFQARGHWPRAYEYYSAELVKQPDVGDLRYRAGLAADRKHDWSTSEQLLAKAVVVKPDQASWHYRLALSRERLGKFSEAAETYEFAIKISQTHQQYWYYRLAQCLEKAGNKQAAVAAYMQLYPNDESLGWIAPDREIDPISKYEHKLIKDNLEHLLLKPESRNSYERGSALLRAGHYITANRILHECVVRDDTQKPERIFRLAVSYVALEDIGAALYWFQQTRSFSRPDAISAEPYFKHKWQRESMEYVEFLETLPVVPNTVMLESYFGGQIDCNPLAIFQQLQNEPDFDHLNFVWVITKSTVVPDAIRSNPKVRLVTRGTTLYRKYLATAGFLINNVTFPHYFTRRSDQKYLNTWHGTPLKTLGRDIQTGFMEHANVSRNFLQATHLLAPNAHTEHVLIQKYDVEGIYSGTVGRIGSPRSDQMIKFDTESKQNLFTELGIPVGQRVIFYAPTWRGSLNTKHFDSERLIRDLQVMQSDGASVIFRAHHMTESLLEGLELGVIVVPSHVSTSSALAITDVLITDYSSIFFDFLPMRKPIVFYAYDLEEYSNERGLYFDLSEMPGEVAFTAEELAPKLHRALEDGILDQVAHESALQKFASHEDGNASSRAVDYLFGSDSTHAIAQKLDSKKVILLHQSLLPNGITSSMVNLINAIDASKYRIIFLFDPSPFQNEPERKENIDLLPSHVQKIARTGAHLVSLEERWVIDKFNAWHEWGSVEQEAIYRRAFNREFRRIFGAAAFDVSVEFDGYAPFWAALMGAEKETVAHRVIYMHNRLQKEWSTKYPELKATFAVSRWFDSLLSVSKMTAQANRDELSEPFSLPYEKFDFADNLMQPERIQELSAATIDTDIANFISTGSEVWLTIGRMSPEKAHKKLFTAFSEHLKATPDAKLVVLGDGPLRVDLEAFIDRSALGHAIMLAGQRSNPFSIMKRADGFILASDHEGQPMVLLEALTIGKPIVATDIIGNRGVLGNSFGMLVHNSVEGLIHGLRNGLAISNNVNFDINQYQIDALHQTLNAFNPETNNNLGNSSE